MNANELFVVGVVLEDSLKIFDLTYNFKIAIKRIDSLKHIVNVRESFDIDFIVEFVDILLKLAVFGNSVVDPKIWNLFYEVLF